MAFQKGKSGNEKGRPVGTTKKYLLERASAITEALDEVGCDPFVVLADIALNGRSEKVRCEAAAELCQYLVPKLKSIEMAAAKQARKIIMDGISFNPASAVNQEKSSNE